MVTTLQSPHFKHFAPMHYGWVVVGGPFIYIVLQLLWPNASILVYQLLCFAMPCLWFCKRAELQNAFNRKRFWTKLAFVLLLSFLVTFSLNSLAEIWENVFPLPDFIVQIYERIFHRDQAYGFYFDMLQIAVVPAFAEELLFRGLILTGLLQRFSPTVAIVLSAAIFALYHLDPWHLPFLFVLGVFFAAVYVKTNNLGLAMLAHFINNTIGVILYYQTGQL